MFVGAFVGAHIAFKYQQHAEKLKERGERVAAIKIAQGSIHSHWSSLKEIHEFLATHKSDLNKPFLNLKDIIRVRSIIPLNIQSLAFLYDGRFANLIQELTLVEGASNTALEALKQRTQMIDQIHADMTDTRNIRIDEKRLTGSLDVVLGSRFVDLTESAESSARDACAMAEKAFEALAAAGKELFPGEKFLKLEEERN